LEPLGEEGEESEGSEDAEGIQKGSPTLTIIIPLAFSMLFMDFPMPYGEPSGRHGDST
jgi:hypothetical protein